MKKILTVAKFLSLGLLNLLIIAVLFYYWLPIARWYLAKRPILGTDFYNTVSYITYLTKYFALRVNGWKYTWFEGQPLSLDYQSFYFYLMLPLVKFFDIIKSVQIFSLISGFLLILFSYLLFTSLSKNRVLSAILALAVGYSVNTYKSLIIAGGIPFFVGQVMFPLVLWLVIKEIRSRHRRWINRRYLVLAGIVSGLGFMGHPQHFVMFIFPSVTILLLFWWYKGLRFFTVQKLKDLSVYFGVTFLVGLPGLYYLFFQDVLVRFATLAGADPLGTGPLSGNLARWDQPGVAKWAREQFYVSFTDTNAAIYALLAITAFFFLIGFIIRKKRVKMLVNTLAILAVGGWVIFYIYLLSVGIDFYHGGLDAWYKLFWSVPIVMGLVASYFWGSFVTSIESRIGNKKKRIAGFVVELVSSLALLILGFLFYQSYTSGVVARIDDSSLFSSTFPEVLSYRVDQDGIKKVKNDVKPSFVKNTSYDFRLYSNNQTFNLWWNSLFETPLARGYVDPPGTIIDRWGLYWMDAAYSKSREGGTSLEDDWNTPEEVVGNNIEFLIDWYAVGYLQGNQAMGSNIIGVLPEILTSDRFIEDKETREFKGGILRRDDYKDTWDDELIRSISYYKVRKDLVSPIHMATNAPRVLVIGGGDSFDILTRFFGMMAYGSDKVIIAKGPAYIDEASFNQLAGFDAVILYKYDYKNHSKSWNKIQKYVESGGKVFIDTGVEVKEASSVDLPARFPKILPAVFPIEKTKRGDLGNFWKQDIKDLALVRGVKTGEFSDFIFDEGPWNISFPPDKDSDVRAGSEVLIYSHGYPVLVEKNLGEGKIIWSGLNLPYHAFYNYNFEEGKMLINVFARLFNFGADVVDYEVNWISPSKREIKASGASGVLIKEKAFPGWKAKISGDARSQKLEIYEVGPSTPGFIFVSVPDAFKDKEFTAEFSFVGGLDSWLANFISLTVLIVGVDYVFLRGRVFGRALASVKSKVGMKVSSWWKEEEYG